MTYYSSSAVFVFSSSGNVSIDNFADPLKGVSSFHCLMEAERQYSVLEMKHLHRNQSTFEIRDDYVVTNKQYKQLRVKSSIWKLGGQMRLEKYFTEGCGNNIIYGGLSAM